VYTFQYSEAHEQAAGVLYRITAEQLQVSVSRTDDFRRDGAVTTGSATLADYRRLSVFYAIVQRALSGRTG
jgi:endonuclease G